jgi:hypothetical protein
MAPAVTATRSITVVTSALFAALAAVFALLAFHSWRKCAAIFAEVEQLAASLRSSRSKIAEIDSAVEGLHDQFHKLRGKFYASRRSSPENSGDSPEATPTNTGNSPPVDAASWKAMMREKHLKPQR